MIEFKICKTCKIEKSLTCFYKNSKCFLGVLPHCIECYSAKNKLKNSTPEKIEKRKEYYIKNKNKILLREKKRREQNKERQKEYNKKYYRKNKEILNCKSKEWIEKNKNYIIQYQKEYRDRNKEQLKKSYKEFYKKNKEKIYKKNIKWLQENKNYFLQWRRKYDKKLRCSPIIKINKNISRAINRSLKGGKNSSWESLVGYTIQQLMKHLESKFKENMTFENYGKGGWHIDHIIPISSFKITSIHCEEFKKCWSLDNLQPLWEKDNLSKGNKIL